MAIAYVQEVAHGNLPATGTTWAMAVAAAPSAGNLVVLSVTCPGAETLASVADSQGNTWSVDRTANNSTSETISVASTVQDVGALTTADTVTLTFSASITKGTGALQEFSGCTNAVDQTSSATSAGASVNAGTTASTTNANDLVWAAFAMGGTETSFTPGTGYSTPTTSFYSGGLSLAMEYQIASATGTFNPTGSIGTSHGSVGACVVYKAATGGATFNDSPSGTITLSATISESATFAASPIGTVNLAGSVSESHSAVDSPAGTITVAGTRLELISFSVAPSGSITLNGSRAESASYTLASTGTIALFGSIIESNSGAPVNPATLWHDQVPDLNPAIRQH